MQIILDRDDITKAMKDYISNMGVDLTGKNVDCSFSAGRSTGTHTATMNITEATSSPVEMTTVAAIEEAVTAPIEEEQVELALEPSDDTLVFDD